MNAAAKRLASLVLALLLLSALLPGNALAADLWETETLADGTLAVAGYRGAAADLEIPESIGGVTVTQIKNTAFKDNDFLVRVTVPGTVVRIGDGAFKNCSGLVSVTLCEGLQEIGYNAFLGCASLRSVNIPLSLTGISAGNNGDAPFSGCSALDEVVFAQGITAIPYSLLRGCTGLTRLQIPDTVTEIGAFAFAGCENLTSVTFPDGLETIGGSAFALCESLGAVTIPESVTSIGSGAFSGCTGLAALRIPGGTADVGGGAFKGCTGLTSVELCEGLQALGSNAFQGCTGLTGIYIPSTLATVAASNAGEGAFAGCTGLERVEFAPGLTRIPNNLLRGCPGITELEIPDNITEIGSYAFQSCVNLASVGLPAALETIGSSAFALCESLGAVTIPESVTSIGSGAFSGCTGLTALRIPGGTADVGGGAFKGCTGLTSVELCEGLQALGSNAFQGCTGLTEIYIPSTLASVAASNAGDGAFAGCTGLARVEFAPGLTRIPNNLLRGCPGITRLEIPENITEIGDFAFQSCVNLASVRLPAALEVVGGGAFSRCESLTDVYYASGRSAWAAIRIGSGNTALTGANIRFTPPGAISSVTAAAATGKITVQWTASSGAVTYIIQRRVKDSGTWTTLNSVVTGTSYEDADGVAGTVYQYRVRGRDGADYGPFKASGVVRFPAENTAPGAISSVTAAATAGKITVSWTASEGAAQYIVQRRVKDSSTWTTLKSNVTGLSYVDTAGEAGTVYQYRVRGRNGTDYGPFKLSSVARFQAGSSVSETPGAISSVTAKASAGKITVTWTASDGATAYIIQRRVKDSDTWTTLKSNVTGTSYVDAAGVAGTVYQYRVRGRDGTLYGPFRVSGVVRALAAN